METNIIRRAIQLGTNITVNSLKNIEGDHIYSPDIYIPNSGKSDELNSPLGDKWVKLFSNNSEHYIVIEAPIINISRRKVITKQAILGIDTSFFQVISNGDYNINMKFSFITDHTWKRTRSDFKEYLTVMGIKDKVQILNSLLNNEYNIQEVVIEGVTETMNENYSNVIDVILDLAKVEDLHIFDEYKTKGSLTINKY